ncbi:MAG: hypothetical protein ABSC47_05495 [Terracidiphilus sp.]
MISGLSPNPNAKEPDSLGAEHLSIALIGPDEERRKAVVSALAQCGGAEVREFSSYPTSLDYVPSLLKQCYDVIIIDLDSDQEFALDLVESICANDSATVMVYSTILDQELVVRCMRAGAREYLTPPFDQNTVAEALVRAAAILHPRTYPTKKTRGRLFVFLGAKGGSGVTTIACNFAIALAQESDQSTLLIDLGLPMGDAALNLGIVAEYSTDNALHDANRLDSNFLLKLLAKHQSGVSVLAAPSKVPEVEASKAAIDKLIAVAQHEFENVIVDIGSRVDLMDTALFSEASTIYLVTQAGISELRNSNRVISRYFNDSSPKLEVVINRFAPSFLGVTEEHITKALSRPVKWKIPDDYDSMREMQSTATSNSLPDSPITRVILEMARSVAGQPAPQEKKKGLSLRGFGRSITEKISTTDKPPAIISTTPSNADATLTASWQTPAPITFGTALSATQLNATASVPGTFVYTPSAGYVLPVGTHTLWVTFTPKDSVGDVAVQAAVSITVSKVTPTIKWPAPAAISCGTALSSTQLNATASVPGTFVYTPGAGSVLPAGTHTLSVTFTPTNDTNYTTAQATVSVTVAKATPAITWPEPDPITCGTALSAAQLNASASVPGTFVYTPVAGAVLAAGMHTLSLVFTPANAADYDTVKATVSLIVVRTTPDIAWPAPATITYGTPLSATQLNATASVPGTFVYIPAAGAVLAAGIHPPSVTFTPKNTANYTKAQATVSLTVAKAKPAISWPAPAPITDSTPFSATQLNARASVPGTFVYTPAAGEVLAAGMHSLSVVFTPADATNYDITQATVSLTVAKTTPSIITWPTPSVISYGTPLSATQLNATASVPGTFVYTPAAGDVLTAGKHILSVTFTPKDTATYATAQASVALVVEVLPDIASQRIRATRMPLTPTAAHDLANARHGESPGGSARNRKGEPETRIYQGATYVKGEDGKWHLQQK